MLLMHLFVLLACVTFCRFSHPLGVRGYLRLMIMALPGTFFPKAFLDKNFIDCTVRTNTVGKQSPWYLSFVYRSQVFLTGHRYF